MEELLRTVVPQVIVAVAAIVGGYLAQARAAKTQREDRQAQELAEWRREGADALSVVGANIFIFKDPKKALRAMANGTMTPKQMISAIDAAWTSEVQHNVERLKRGHPSPKVRAAASEFVDIMWAAFMHTRDLVEVARDSDWYAEACSPDSESLSKAQHAEECGAKAQAKLDALTEVLHR